MVPVKNRTQILGEEMGKKELSPLNKTQRNRKNEGRDKNGPRLEIYYVNNRVSEGEKALEGEKLMPV